jgi:hypothetical protein
MGQVPPDLMRDGSVAGCEPDNLATIGLPQPNLGTRGDAVGPSTPTGVKARLPRPTQWTRKMQGNGARVRTMANASALAVGRDRRLRDVLVLGEAVLPFPVELAPADSPGVIEEQLAEGPAAYMAASHAWRAYSRLPERFFGFPLDPAATPIACSSSASHVDQRSASHSGSG